MRLDGLILFHRAAVGSTVAAGVPARFPPGGLQQQLQVWVEHAACASRTCTEQQRNAQSVELSPRHPHVVFTQALQPMHCQPAARVDGMPDLQWVAPSTQAQLHSRPGAGGLLGAAGRHAVAAVLAPVALGAALRIVAIAEVPWGRGGKGFLQMGCTVVVGIGELVCCACSGSLTHVESTAPNDASRAGCTGMLSRTVTRVQEPAAATSHVLLMHLWRGICGLRSRRGAHAGNGARCAL